MDVTARRIIGAAFTVATLTACTPAQSLELSAEPTPATSARAPIPAGINGLAEEQETGAAAAVAEAERVAAEHEAARVAAEAEATRKAAEEAEAARTQQSSSSGSSPNRASTPKGSTGGVAPAPAPAPAPVSVSQGVTLSNRSCAFDGATYSIGFTMVFSNGATRSFSISQTGGPWINDITLNPAYGGHNDFFVEDGSYNFEGVGNC